MRHTFTWIMVSCIGFAACHSSKKISKTLPANNIIHQDSAKQVTIAAKPTIDSALMVKDIWNSCLAHQASFKTLSAKLNVDIDAVNLNQTVNASLRMKKDSLMWLSLTGPFGIEGGRVKIFRDSIFVINKLNKSFEHYSFAYAQRLLQQPITFQDVQALLLGGPLLQSSNIESYKLESNGNWTIVLKRGNTENHIVLDPIRHLILSNTLKDLKHPNQTCTIKYGNFQSELGNIPKDIDIHVSGNKSIKIQLNYKQGNFNQTLEYPFNIPSGYSVH